MRWTFALWGAAVVSAFLLGDAVALILIAAAAALVLTLCSGRPKLSVALAVPVILFSQAAQQVTGIGLMGYLDDAAVLLVAAVCILPRWLRNEPMRRLPGGRWFVAYVLVGLVIAVIQSVPMALAVQDLLLFTKGAIFGFAVAQVEWSLADVRRMSRIALAIIGALVLSAVLNFIAPDWWSENFALTGFADVRGVVPSLIGLAAHPGPFGHLMALTALGALAHYQIFRSSGSKQVAAVATIGVLLSYRRKALAGLVVGALWLVRPGRGAGRPVAIAALALVLIGLVASDSVSSQVERTRQEYVTNGDEAARTVLTRDGIELAIENFPIGVGPGRFGGHVATEHYSPVYEELGYHRIYGLAEGSEEQFGRDTFWPAIMGQNGVVGLVLYAGGLLALFQAFRRARRSVIPQIAYLGLVGVMWSSEYFVESLASPVYTGPPSFALLFGLGGVLAGLLPDWAAQRPDPLRFGTSGAGSRVSSISK